MTGTIQTGSSCWGETACCLTTWRLGTCENRPVRIPPSPLCYSLQEAPKSKGSREISVTLPRIEGQLLHGPSALVASGGRGGRVRSGRWRRRSGPGPLGGICTHFGSLRPSPPEDEEGLSLSPRFPRLSPRPPRHTHGIECRDYSDGRRFCDTKAACVCEVWISWSFSPCALRA
jgi:hypothetical protein